MMTSGVATSWLGKFINGLRFRGLTPPGYKLPPLRGYTQRPLAGLDLNW
jgi:hypothetical protein